MRGRLVLAFVAGVAAMRLILAQPWTQTKIDQLAPTLSVLLGRARFSPLSPLNIFVEDPEKVCSIRTCWKPCLGSAFTYHEFDLGVLRDSVSKGVFSPGLQLKKSREDANISMHTADPNEACLRIVTGVPCKAADRNEFFERLPEAVGGSSVWKNGENVLIVSQCDETIDIVTRRNYLGRAAIAQNHCLRDNYIPEFDLSLPLAPQVEVQGQTRHDKIFGNRKYLLTFKGSTYAERPPPPGYLSGARAPQKLGQHRTQLKALHDPSRRVIILLRCLDREMRFFPETLNCSGWNQEFETYDYMDLLNSTFALIPGGRSPGTYRLTEAMAAGSIPVFVDQFDDQIYVRPLDGIIPWELMSVRIPASMAHTLIPSLLKWTNEDIIAARERCVEAAETFLSHYQDLTLKIYKNRLSSGMAL